MLLPKYVHGYCTGKIAGYIAYRIRRNIVTSLPNRLNKTNSVN